MSYNVVLDGPGPGYMGVKPPQIQSDKFIPKRVGLDRLSDNFVF